MGSHVQGRSRKWMAAAVAIAVSWLLLATHFEAADTDLKVDYDKSFSFTGVRTWTWHPDGPGDVRLAVSSQDDPKRVAARVDPVIVPAVEREMTARGFARATATPDVYVHYYVLATVNQSAQSLGQFLPPTGEWGLPPFNASTTALSIYPVGTLIIDVSSPAAKAVVWRGAAQRKINLERPDDERRKVLDKAIRDLLKRFPPKK
ncbi:MAG: hypothetical protein C5B57_09350 [Blastocatellia bacterium]|nr:MAG: hypothetical protein C5B57_09350 [Blastocatellia bacterium]